MRGYSPKLPLVVDPADGFRLTKTIKEVVAQNLKMLMLTSPGERIMEPTFGIGLYNFLFENNTSLTQAKIRNSINRQVRKYMPFINIVSIKFGEAPNQEGPDIDKNTLNIVVEYAIPSLGEVDFLNILI